MVAIQAKRLDLEAMLTTRLEADKLRVPPYPAIAFKLQELSRSGRYSSRDLCATINADAALVASVLRRANASASGSTVAISSLEAAVTRLGIEELLRLSLAQSAGVTATGAGPLALLRREAWRSSLLSARIALELAERRGVSQDEAFVAGLLHDFGAITVVVGLEDLKVELPVLPAETWKILVDRLHVKFGTVIARRWNLPPAVTHAIQHHHDVAAYQGPHRALVELIATVDQVIAIFDRAPDTGVAALLEVTTLSEDERYKIGAMVPQIAQFMSAFEASAHADKPSAVAPTAPPLDESWAVDLIVRSKRGDLYQAHALTPSTIAFRGTTPMTPGWLSELVIQLEPEIDMLANVKSCEAHSAGGYVMIAQPFGLDGPAKKQWYDLVSRARRG